MWPDCQRGHGSSGVQLTIDLSPAQIIPQVLNTGIADCPAIEGRKWECQGGIREMDSPRMNVVRCEGRDHCADEFATSL